MYIRFVLPFSRADSRAEAGFFYRAYDVSRAECVPVWIRAELGRELDWFGAHLDVPGRLVRRFRRRRPIHGICWFRPEAGEHINRARYAGWLMSEAGAPVREIRIAEPGEVIWRDAHQIVAKPPAGLPRGFH